MKMYECVQILQQPNELISLVLFALRILYQRNGRTQGKKTNVRFSNEQTFVSAFFTITKSTLFSTSAACSSFFYFLLYLQDDNTEFFIRPTTTLNNTSTRTYKFVVSFSEIQTILRET